MKVKEFGLLMPISSLWGNDGIGTLGKSAYNFIDFLKSSGAKVWQVLPTVPTNYGDSPYQSCSSSAVNYYFIDLEDLISRGLLTEEEVKAVTLFYEERRVDYGLQFYNKIELLRKAFSNFNVNEVKFKRFIKKGEFHDFAVFMALKVKFSHKPWTEWDEEFKIYNEERVNEFINSNLNEYHFWLFTQYIFLIQWKNLKNYANKNKIKIMGDIPLYVAYDSVEMWKYGEELFQVDSERKPSFVAGVPPDAFSDEGQLWGNPLYDWERMKKDGYSWWNNRLKTNFKLFDILRIDHFRGFDRYYRIPFGEETAKNGEWVDGPKEDFFKDKLSLNIVAEDLGVIDDGVIRLMKNVAYPGMKVLEFAFDCNLDNPHKPCNYDKNCLCYTGTHDNMPLKQYVLDLNDYDFNRFKEDLTKECKKLKVKASLSSADDICKAIIRLAFKSKANLTILPVWDLLIKGGEARINFPSTVSNANWTYRFLEGELSIKTAKWLKTLAKNSNRI